MKKLDLSAFLFLFLSLRLFAQPQLLDNSFSADGRQTLTLPGYDQVGDVLVLPDGKILTAGASYHLGENRISLTRYHPDGTLDTSFGIAGKNHTLDPHDVRTGITEAGLQSDGKIVVLGGTCAYYQHLVRYLPNGYPDESNSFPVSLNPQMCYRSLAIDSNDKIVLAGQSTGKFLVFRFNQSGSKDLTFGTNSVVHVDFGNADASAWDVAMQPDGKIVAAGIALAGDKSFALARMHPDGSLDSSFGTAGKVLLDPPKSARSPVVALQPDGKILLAGSGTGGPNPHFYLFRLNPDGTRDSTFSSDGEITITIFLGAVQVNDMAVSPDGSIYVSYINKTGGHIVVRVLSDGTWDTFAGSGFLDAATTDNLLAVQADQKIVVAGTAGGDFGLVRYLPDGTADPDFHNANHVITNIGESGGYFNALALQTDGKIIAVGRNDNYEFDGGSILARLSADGGLDTSFNASGSLTSGNASEFGNAVALQPDGKIVVGTGYGDMYGQGGGQLARFLPDGTPDSAFVSTSPYVAALALQPDGKILTLGVEHSDSGPEYSKLVRHLADGSYDAAFGNQGQITSTTCYCDKLALQPDGKILVAGTGDPDFSALLLRRHPDGALDQSFGANGTLTWKFGIGATFPRSLLLQPDGKILLGVESDNPGYAVARFQENGEPDNSFGTGGTVELGFVSWASAMALLPDGKILLGGTDWSQPTSPDFFLGRLLPDGTPDSTAGINGFVITDFDNIDDEAYALAVQADGKILLAGTSGGRLALARYRADLSLESKEVNGPRFYPLKITPNPVTDFLNLQLPETAANAPAEVQVFDAQGRLVLSRALTPGQALHVRSLPSGVYTLRVVAGERAYVGRFVKP